MGRLPGGSASWEKCSQTCLKILLVSYFLTSSHTRPTETQFWILRCFFYRFRPIQKEAGRPYDSFPPIFTPRAPSCIRKLDFPSLEMISKTCFLCLYMRVRSGDTLARWSTVVRLPTGLARGRRTPEAPGSRLGLETSNLPKARECVWPFLRGLFMPPKTRPRVVR